MAGVALVAGATVLSAQSTGKVEGKVKDAQGKPIANATVYIVGTAFSNVTNASGYYFINNVPPGTMVMRAAYPGYKPFELSGLRMISGQTIEQDFTLEQQAQNVQEIEVKGTAKNALVPRDQVTSRQLLSGEMVDKLPVDRLNAAFAFQPGVTASVCNSSASSCSPSLSVRGSRTDEQATYLDGVPVSNGARSLFTPPSLGIATNAFEDASITTGASSSEFGNAQGGIINITTKTGGSKYSGSLNYETTNFPGRYGSNFNMFQGSFGGPIAKNFTFFVSAKIEGAQSGNGGYGGWNRPAFTRVKIDTTFRLGRTAGGGTAGLRSDSIDVNVYDLAVVKGDCANFSFVQNASLQAMRDNYGYKCSSNRTATNPGGTYYLAGKLNYTFGRGSRMALSYNTSGTQARNGLSDGRTQGSNSFSNVATLNWTQTLTRSAARSVSLDAYLSYQWNNDLNSPITVASEASTRKPWMGFLLKPLDYEFTPQNFPLDSTLIYNILFNRANHRIGLIDKTNTSQYNGLTTYGACPPDLGGCAGTGGGGGNDLAISYDHENRTVGKINLDAQVDRYNRLKLGAEGTRYDIASMTGGTAGTNTILVKPVRYDFFAEDRLDLGDVVLVGGLRYDYYWSKAWRWRDFPRISTRPGFNPDSLYCKAGSTAAQNAGSICTLVQDPSHDYVSPHIQVSFPVTEKTNFRLSYAHQVQAPDFGLVLRQATSDIDVGGVNSRSSWGSDLDFGKTVQFEFGARHAFSEDMVLDVAVYNKDNLANPAIKFSFPIDPINGQGTRLYTAQNTDFGNARGIDVTLQRRIGNYLNGTLGYSFISVKNTGTDPFSYINFFETLVGANAEPPLAALPVGTSRPHTLTGQFNISLPADFKQGTLLGSILHKTGVYTTFRLASGTSYTRCDPADAASLGVTSGGSCGSLPAVTGYNGARLPMYKQFDTRFTRDFRMGKLDMTAYLDARNILNLKNTTSLWATTGTISNGAYATQLWVADSNTFAQFGTQSGTRQANGDLKLPTTLAGCASFKNGTTPTAPSCYNYIRSEQRYGNGDGTYTMAEQKAVSDLTRYTNTFAPYNFVTGGRSLRFGLEVNF
jgi:outer membrane receptor for ferrienterochelin and colicin